MNRKMRITSQQIVKLATQFRNAIEKAKDLNVISCQSLRNFPVGSCGIASELLAQFLFENNVQTQYVWGTHYPIGDEAPQSHAWLESLNGITIDITRDQFKYDNELLNWSQPIYVGEPDCFQSLFEGIRYSSPGYMYEVSWSKGQQSDYYVICDCLT